MVKQAVASEQAGLSETACGPREIVKTYDNWIIRAYSQIRFVILRQSFLEEIDQYLPRVGRILDLGCGFGLFSLYFAAQSQERNVMGIDLDRKRIQYARTSAARLGLSNVEYMVGDAAEWVTEEEFDAIYMLDLVHHLPQHYISEFLHRIFARLRAGGVLLIKDVEDRPRWKMLFTLLLDRLMVGSEPIHYWSAPELIALLEQVGFSVVKHRMKDFLPYPHVLYVCRAPVK
jgi:2-polyprenyl-6-hydroxyphenyl methylase/3-demethylubiquinone-9 3-methyltransferase